MPDLPSEPSLQQLRHQARDLQRAVRRGDQDALAEVAGRHPAGPPGRRRGRRVPAERRTARHRPSLRISELGSAQAPPRTARRGVHRVPRREVGGQTDDLADEFIRLACLNYGDDNVERRLGVRAGLLAEHPEVTVDREPLRGHERRCGRGWRRRLTADPSPRPGPRRPIPVGRRCSISPTPVTIPTCHADAALATARILLDHGADPNAGYLWHGLATPFTVLTGVFGSGEQGPVAPAGPSARTGAGPSGPGSRCRSE